LLFKAGQSGITITSYPGETAVLQGIVEDRNGANNDTLDSVIIQGTGTENTVKTYASGFTLSSSTITNNALGRSCLILGNHGYGEAISPTITGNTFHDCGAPANGNLDHAIYDSWSQDARITNNLIYRTQAYAIQLYPDAHGTLFDHNTVDGGDQSTRGGVVFGGDSTYASADNTVSNNVIAYAATYNLTSSWGSSKGSGNTAIDNCLWGGVLGNIKPDLSGVTLTNNLIANPLFINRSARDYRLQPGSLCAGKGASPG
jgi:hypothetical protein